MHANSHRTYTKGIRELKSQKIYIKDMITSQTTNEWTKV